VSVQSSPIAAMTESFTTPDGRLVLIRSCSGFDELDACVQLQIDTWGYSDGDVIPRRAFIVAQRIGGQVIGAFDASQPSTEGDAGKLIGFALSLPGIKPADRGEPTAYLHSHMLAVSTAYRNAGIGQRLKLFQRMDALNRGIRLMEWTFDPLEIKNSFLNIHKLGVVVQTYTSNFYGVSSSRLQGGLPSDRLHAEWYLDSARVKAILNGNAPPLPEVRESIRVPRDIGIWKSSEENVNRALVVQMENRQRFQAAFARGLAVIGFRTDIEGNGIFQLAPFEI
jgi:predicted GNAT superfamily acetyltransferase